MIKADFHIHTGEDPEHPWIKYSSREIIDLAAKKNYGALAITCHDHLHFSESLENYAKKKGIILFPGVERTIEGAHILIINATEDIYEIYSFKDLREYKKENEVLIIAAHPSYIHSSIGPKIKKHKDCIDALEHSFYYTKFFNPNKITRRWARQMKLPMFANSDSHGLKFFDRNYSLIDAKKNKKSIIEAVKKGRVKIKSQPLSTKEFLNLGFSVGIATSKQILKTLFNKA